MNKFFLLLVFLLSVLQKPLIAEKDLQLITLENGMKLAIKKIESSPEDVQFRLLAFGGFNNFSNEVKVSARLAAQIAWESGLGDLSVDQVFALMHQNSIDITSKIQAFSREITGTCHKDSLGVALELVNWLFMKAKVSQEAVELMVEKTENVLRNRPLDRELTYDDIRYAINTNHHRYFKPFTIKSLRKIDAELVEAIYRDAFGDPKEYVAVIVGDVDLEKAVEFAKKFLGSIEFTGKRAYAFTKPATIPPFPEFPVKKNISNIERGGSGISVEYTFPVFLKNKLSLREYKLLTFITQLLEKKIRDTFLSTQKRSFGVDVGYILPFYPFLDSPWLDIQYRTESVYQEQTEREIFLILEELQKEGPTAEEINYIKKYLESADEFWTKESSFWVNNLTNFLLWGWNLNEVLYEFSDQEEPTSKQIQDFLKANILLDRYTRIISQ